MASASNLLIDTHQSRSHCRGSSRGEGGVFAPAKFPANQPGVLLIWSSVGLRRNSSVGWIHLGKVLQRQCLPGRQPASVELKKGSHFFRIWLRKVRPGRVAPAMLCRRFPCGSQRDSPLIGLLDREPSARWRQAYPVTP
jgi:hypothetical protein